MARHHDPIITLSEEDGVRYLHFGSEWVQGAMKLSRPESLHLDYLQRMMAWLLFLDGHQDILQLGLGAGSLTRFTHRRLPASRTLVVERSEEVIEVAHHWFGLPQEDARLQIVAGDAGAFVADPAQRDRFGVIQVDLYDEQAQGPVLDSERFYRRCHRALRSPGVLVVNLFGWREAFTRSLDRLNTMFGGRVIAMPPTPAGNRIVLAFKGPPLSVSVEQLARRAALIERSCQLRGAVHDWLQALKVPIAASPSARAARTDRTATWSI